MASSGKNSSTRDVLCYRFEGVPQGTVRRHYLRWRREQDPPLPERCDNPQCCFYTKPLIWNGLYGKKELKPILDHINGNNSDNSPQNLRLLCPNCDSQLVETRGGANKGRVQKATGGFALVSRDGKKRYILPAEPGAFLVSGQEAQLTVRGHKGK